MARKNTTPKKVTRNRGTIPAKPSLWQRMRQGIRSFDLREYFKADTVRFIIGFCVMGASLFLLISFVSNVFTGRADQAGVEAGELRYAANYAGKLGAYVSHYFMDGCFGLTSVFIPLFTLLVGVKLMGAYRVRLWKWFLNFSIVMIWGSLLFSLLTPMLPVGSFGFRLGGSHGDVLNAYLSDNLGAIGAWMVLVSVAIFYFLYLTRETIDVVRRLMHPQDLIRKPDEEREDDGDEEEMAGGGADGDIVAGADDGATATDESTQTDNGGETGMEEEGRISVELDPVSSIPEADDDPCDEDENKPDGGEAKLSIAETKEDAKAGGRTVGEVKSLEPYDPRKSLEFYKYPPISLLKHYDDKKPAIDMTEQNANKDRIINVLRNFGVEITTINATIGATITLYEVTPAPGVRINKIRNLEDDIALSLSALGIRIIAPIPGKGTIGIEVPNKNPRIVSMESIINTKKFSESTYDLPIALGKTITNEVFMVDLAKMPHLLVAGATGQGKSVGLNAIITSLLYKKHPAELKFVMVDPKKVEFSIYASIEKHFLAKIPDDDADPIITDVTKVVQTLKSLCQLMDHRYDLLKKAKVRNIKEYNAKFKARQLNPENGHDFMPYIVVIIDEFGDLIMTAGKEVELPIARIAQLARAVGMHMVIATQRPTTNIITGTIKANFPARMAFKVMSQIDSRTILDQSGANQLVGKGDMLFLAANTPVRVQCAFVDTPEVERINDFVSRQQGYLSALELPEPEVDGEGGGGSTDLDSDSLDPMFGEAARLIVIHQQGSTSLIQRKFSIGYNRAGRLMDQLERAGIVGPGRGSKPREVLISDEIELESKLATLK